MLVCGGFLGMVARLRPRAQASEVSLMWSPAGNALLIHTHTEVILTLTLALTLTPFQPSPYPYPQPSPWPHF